MNREMEFQEVIGESKTKVLKFDANRSNEDTIVSAFKHKGFHFVEIGPKLIINNWST